jgi:hypothetical protein
LSFDLYVFDSTAMVGDESALTRWLEDSAHWDQPLTEQLVAFVAVLEGRHPRPSAAPDTSPWANEAFTHSVGNGHGVGMDILWSESERMAAEIEALAAEHGLVMHNPKASPPPTPRQPHDGIPRCAVCAREPALTLAIRRQQGLLVIRRRELLRQPLCRDHGVESSKAYLKETLLTGWWGFISLFTNVGVVVNDLSALRKYRRLAAPEHVPLDGHHDGEGVGSWEVDPFRRSELRWRGASGWSDSVSTHGAVFKDSPGWR